MKVVTGPNRQLAGATIVGPDVGNLIHELDAAAGGVHRPATG